MGPSILFNIVFFQFLLPHGCRLINSTQESVFGTVFDDNLKAAVVAGKAPLDALTMDTKLGERYREFQQLLRQELDEARAEASAAARAEAQQGAGLVSQGFGAGPCEGDGGAEGTGKRWKKIWN